MICGIKVQLVLQGRGKNRKSEPKNFPYTGLIKCGGTLLDNNSESTHDTCGYAISGEIKRRSKNLVTFTFITIGVVQIIGLIVVKGIRTIARSTLLLEQSLKHLLNSKWVKSLKGLSFLTAW